MMIATRANETRTLVVAGQAIDFDDEKIDLIRRTIAKGSSNDELALFIEQCRRTGLDPFARQIYAVRRKQWDNNLRSYVEAQIIQVSIDGYRLVADRTNKYAGQVGPWWCGPDGEWREVWLKDEPPAAARIGVLRHDFHQPIYSIALFKSYVQLNGKGEPISRWKSDPAGMLAKCAEALALRRAFPQELSGLYTGEEMDQADNPVTVTVERVPAPELTQPESVQWLEATIEGAAVTEVTEPEQPPAELENATEAQPDEPKQPAPAKIVMTLDEAKAVEASDGKPYGGLTLAALVNRANNMRKILKTAESAGDLEAIATYRHKLAACDLLIPWRREVGDPETTDRASSKPEEKKAPAPRKSKSEGAEKEAETMTALGFNEPETGGDKYADLVKMTDKTTAFWMLTNRARFNREQATRVLADAGDDFTKAFNDLLALVRAA